MYLYHIVLFIIINIYVVLIVKKIFTTKCQVDARDLTVLLTVQIFLVGHSFSFLFISESCWIDRESESDAYVGLRVVILLSRR
jgi:hypothetical protein